MLQFDPQLSAKVFKRVAQLRRLGPRGIIHTAYVRTLGPAVYALTDPHEMSLPVFIGSARWGALCHFALTDSRNGLRARSTAANARESASTRIGVLGHSSRRLRLCLTLRPPRCAVPRPITVDWDANSITCRIYEESGDELNEEMRARIEDALLESTAQATCSARSTPTTLYSALAAIPVVVNLQHSIPLEGLSRDMSVFLRDADRRAFNDLFGTRLLTADQLRRPALTQCLDRARQGPRVHAKFMPPWSSATTSAGARSGTPISAPAVELHHEGTPPDPSRWNRPRPR